MISSSRVCAVTAIVQAQSYSAFIIGPKLILDVLFVTAIFVTKQSRVSIALLRVEIFARSLLVFLIHLSVYQSPWYNSLTTLLQHLCTCRLWPITASFPFQEP